MEDFTSREALLLSLQRALLGEVHPQLRQASIEADATERVVRLRFEYDGQPPELVRESCSCVATEVIADFPGGWDLDEQHLAVPMPGALTPCGTLRTAVPRPKMPPNNSFKGMPLRGTP